MKDIDRRIDAWVHYRASTPGYWQVAGAYTTILLVLLLLTQTLPGFIADRILWPWVRISLLLIIAEILPNQWLLLRGGMRIIGDAWLIVTLVSSILWVFS